MRTQIGFLLFLVILFGGCGRDYDDVQTAEIQIAFAPSLQTPDLKVVIEILRVNENGDEISFDPPITETLIFDGKTTPFSSLSVPVGTDRVIVASGYEYGELIYEGRQHIPFVGNEPIIADITLDPVGVPLLSINTPKKDLRVGEEVPIEIQIKNVENLFGVIVELEYTRSRLFALNAETTRFAEEQWQSDFTKSAIPLIHDLNLGATPGRIAIALTLTHGQEPIFVGRDAVTFAVATFRAVKAGFAEVKVRSVRGITPRLTDPDGDPLPRLEDTQKYLTPSVGTPRGVIEFEIN